MSATSDALPVSSRDPSGSRSARRLRREGQVPGVVYGGDGEPQPVQVERLTLNRFLAHAGSVIEIAVDGSATPVLIKETVRHPVTGQPQHVDFLRVKMDEAIQTTVFLELTGVDDAPGVVEGGILAQEMRELTVEALPGDIPDTLTHDVSGMGVGATLTLAELSAPDKVSFVDDPETVVATITLPTPEVEETDDVELETEVVGEQAGEGVGEAAAETPGGDAATAGGDAAQDTDTGTTPG
jgi:large subunit ribosomal protein L25